MFWIFLVLAGTGAAAALGWLDWTGLGLSSRIRGDRICRMADPLACPPESVCISKARKGKGAETGVCTPRHVGPKPVLKFPFPPDHAVRCVLGPKGVPESGLAHTTLSTRYALAFSTPGKKSKPGTIYSGYEGTAIVYNKCSRRNPKAEKGAPDGPDCGKGLGNHVRVLTPEGYMVLYAHLGSVWVRDKQVIRKGDAIGQEGHTGDSPDRMLRVSVHFTPPTRGWLETLSYYRTHPGETPPSIPFEIQYCDPADPKECRRKRSRVSEIPCQNTVENAPLLRADWRT